MMAQQMPQMPPLPVDPAVRMGQLPNGLTYYIRHNELPEHHAEFYIAQRVGSILEEKSQRGLAHFLEHMAFNGTKNFPGKNMLDYLERNGVKFGTNVNAYTSIEETVYNISDVPTDETHPGIIDSCLLMLHDWSGCISLLDEEIEAERGVIHEEWRSRSSAQMRMYETILPKLYPNNRYADCMPIGSKVGDNHLAVVDDFKPAELRDYYQKWYRPDLQGIFVVGDVDVDAIEQKITELWSDIHVPEGAPERVYFPVEDNVEPLIAVASDVEQQYNIMNVMWKSDPMPDEMKLTQMGYVQNIVLQIINTAINQRMEELCQKADAPFLQAGASYDNYVLSRTKDAFSVAFIFAENQWQKGLNAAMQVALSAAQFGLTDSEVERAKADMLANAENAFNERDKRKNRQHIREIQAHFLHAEPMPGIEMEYQMLQQILPMFNAAMINQIMSQLVTEQNVAIMLMGQKVDSNVLPTEEELLAAYKEALKQEVKPYEEALSGIELLPNKPAKAGKIVKEEQGAFDSKVWTLSNGAQVIWKKTDFKQDQIMFEAASKGGYRLFPELSNLERSSLSEILTLGGIGQFSTTDLPKVLAGKRADIDAYVGTLSEGLTGSATPKDLRTLFELIYLAWNEPRYDEEAYQAWYNRNVTQMQMMEGNPQKIMSDSLSLTLHKEPSEAPIQLADFQKLDYRRLFDLAAKRFDNAADFRFYFVGNIDEDSLRQLSCQYIATLPANKAREERPKALLITPGSRQNIFDLPMEDPKTTVYNVRMLYDEPYNVSLDLKTSMLGQAVSMVFLETIREQEGAAYSPHAQGGAGLENYAQLVYVYETGADKLDRAEELAKQELEKLANEGVPADKFQKIHDYMAKRHQEQVKENSYWMNNLQLVNERGIDNVTTYDAVFEAITSADLQALAKRFLSQDATDIKFIARGVNK